MSDAAPRGPVLTEQPAKEVSQTYLLATSVGQTVKVQFVHDPEVDAKYWEFEINRKFPQSSIHGTGYPTRADAAFAVIRNL